MNTEKNETLLYIDNKAGSSKNPALFYIIETIQFTLLQTADYLSQ